MGLYLNPIIFSSPFASYSLINLEFLLPQIFDGKYLCRSLFLIKLQAWNFMKKRFQYRSFPVNIAKFLKTFLYKTLPVATFGYSNQSRIFQEITTLKFQGQHASQSDFCRHEGLCPATKTEILRCWLRWNFQKFQISFSEK